MRHAIYLPPFGDFADPARTIDLALAAEEAGWDAIYLWDHIWRPTVSAVADVWVTLAAIATATSSIRLGPMVTPLARRRPQKVAREAVTLDHLSGGRLTLGVGLGVDTGGELGRFGEVTDPAARGDHLDEALEVLLALWSGEVIEHHGAHFRVDGVAFRPTPLQQPRIPVWGAARGGSPARPLRRAAALDGLFPVSASLEQLDRMLEVVARERGSLDGYDVAFWAAPDADLEEHAARGVTWSIWGPEEDEPTDEVFGFVAAGPPAS